MSIAASTLWEDTFSSLQTDNEGITLNISTEKVIIKSASDPIICNYAIMV